MNSVSTCTQLETNDNSLNVADSGKLGDNVDGAELFVVHTETLSIFRASTAHTELNFPCWPIKQVILSQKIRPH